MMTKDYTLEINELLEELSLIDADNIKQVLPLENLIRKTKNLIKNKGELFHYYDDNVNSFKEFTETKEYKKICKIISNYLKECVRIYSDVTKSTPPKFLDETFDKSIIISDLFQDYTYSLLYFASSYWLVEYIKSKNLSYMLKNCYNNIIDFYSSISGIILSNIETEKEAKINSLLIVELQKDFGYIHKIHPALEIYLFELLTANRKKYIQLDIYSSRLIYKSIINNILNTFKHEDIIKPPVIRATMVDKEHTIICKGIKIKFEPEEYKTIKACLDITLQNNDKIKITSEKVSKINKKFKDNGFPSFIPKKTKIGYLYNHVNYNIE